MASFRDRPAISQEARGHASGTSRVQGIEPARVHTFTPPISRHSGDDTRTQRRLTSQNLLEQGPSEFAQSELRSHAVRPEALFQLDLLSYGLSAMDWRPWQARIKLPIASGVVARTPGSTTWLVDRCLFLALCDVAGLLGPSSFRRSVS
jgi:hypothetical protein